MMKPYSRLSRERSAIRAMLVRGGPPGRRFFYTRAPPARRNAFRWRVLAVTPSYVSLLTCPANGFMGYDDRRRDASVSMELFGIGQEKDIGLRGNSTCNRYHCHAPVSLVCRKTVPPDVPSKLSLPSPYARCSRSDAMWKAPAIATTILAAASSRVQAQTDLTAYADANGYINVQALPS